MPLLALLAFLFSCAPEDLEGLEGELLTVTEPALDAEGMKEPAAKPEDAVKNWIYAMAHPSGLLESAENTNFVSLYDNALAAIFFMEEGHRQRAERIFDFFDARMETELLAGTGGFFQFRDVTGGQGSRRWPGDNAWLLLALNQYHYRYGTHKYKELRDQLELWIRSLQEADGALVGGYNEDGTVIPKVTEGMITAFKAVPGHDHFHRNLLKYLKHHRWDEELKILLSWPENPSYAHALDVHTLGSLIFPGMAPTLLPEAQRFKTTQTLLVNGTQIQGYCFDEDRDVIWLEGTAQMAVALNAHKDQSAKQRLVREVGASVMGSALHPGTQGVPYASNHGSNYGASPLWDHAATAPALSATLWYIFAKEGINPFFSDAPGNIPEEDRFW
ncbi:hypothetical protein [Maribacter sp. 2307ULW6-5]|uniref:hypothetical protein n=1 Tax=Maribacter sp. 2307ULW6-5 TaxID=3386275 RepID=UPI0039BD5998